MFRLQNSILNTAFLSAKDFSLLRRITLLKKENYRANSRRIYVRMNFYPSIHFRIECPKRIVTVTQTVDQ